MLSEQIKLFRKKMNLTQQQLGDFLQVSHDTVSLWEKNKSKPDIEMLKKLCILFNCTADELLEIETPSERAKVQINNSFNGNNINVKIK